MEKRKPTYELERIKQAMSNPATLAVTTTAAMDAAALGYNRKDVVRVIQGMQRQHFHKSMTTFADHRLWQDVYHVPDGGLILYVKVQADRITEFRLMSFKER